MHRTNEDWLTDLQASGEQRETALTDLRAIIIAGLPYALSKWILPADPRFSSLVEEVTQETILRAIAKLDSFEGRSQFTTWVHTIAVRIALTELRRAKWREVSLDEMQQGNDPEDEAREMPDQSQSVEKSIENKEMMHMLQQVMQHELTDKQRKALMAVAVQGMPLEEVARRMGTERNALYKLLHDSRLKLKKHLEKQGLSPLEILAMFEQ
jgi:RNA polymerase sigma-70 factor (ECF subfamily)